MGKADFTRQPLKLLPRWIQKRIFALNICEQR